MFSYYGKFQVKGMIHLLLSAVSRRMVHVLLNAFHLVLLFSLLRGGSNDGSCNETTVKLASKKAQPRMLGPFYEIKHKDCYHAHNIFVPPEESEASLRHCNKVDTLLQ